MTQLRLGGGVGVVVVVATYFWVPARVLKTSVLVERERTVPKALFSIFLIPRFLVLMSLLRFAAESVTGERHEGLGKQEASFREDCFGCASLVIWAHLSGFFQG